MEIERIGIREDVLPDDYLKLSDGRIVKNLVGLVEVLRVIDKNSFDIHVCASYNDFSEWVMDVYGEESLSKKIGKTRNKEKMIRILNEFVRKVDKSSANRIDAPKGKKDTLKMLGESSGEM